MRRVLLALISIGVLVALTGGTASSGKEKGHIAKQAAQGTLRPATLSVTQNGTTTNRQMPFLSGSSINAAQDALCADQAVPNCDERSEAADSGTVSAADLGQGDVGIGEGTLGCSRRDKGHAHGDGGSGNVRVNQDCSFRRQAEEEILYHFSDPNNLVAGQNDSRVGYNQCGIDWSTNNGSKWGDLLPPFRQKLNNPASQEPTAGDPNRHTIDGGPGTFHTYDAGSDPALATDSAGRSYFSCVTFDVASNASGLYVTQSPQGAQGSFYFNWTGRPFTVAEDNDGLIFHDKNFIAADPYKSSPNRDNVYVTWTVFKYDDSGNYQQSPIFGSMSTDHGIHWSTPEDISGASDTLCFFGDAFDPSLSPHKCDFDQGSDPVVLPNGDLEVIFNNGNTPAGNPNGQQLAVHCKPTGSSPAGTAHLNCASPAKVGDDILVGEPQCDFGRGPEECIPGAYIRTNDFPRINTQNTQNNHLYASWQDYRNGEFDIQLSVSTDGGLTWHEAGTVNPDTGLDHYFPADDQTPKGDDKVGVSYYRTERVPNENTTPAGGFAPGANPGVQDTNSDYVLAGGTFMGTPFDFKVISPVFPPPDGIQAGFNGDYSGLAINKGDEAHPIWSDTRNVDPYAPANGVLHDEDVFTDKVGLPNGKGKVGPGKIGKK
jgi:hypothetical protein